MTLAAWERWQLWRKAQAAREVWDAWLRDGVKAKLSDAQQELFNWPASEDY